MAVRSSYKFDSPIFDKPARRQAFSSFVSRSAKDFKVLTKDRMVRDRRSGRLYEKKRGTGFRRAHRASAPGQRPSPDTMTLVNATSDRRIGEFVCEVYIAERMNPENGAVASNYAEILQERLDRPIMSPGDAAEAEAKMAREGHLLIQRLIG